MYSHRKYPTAARVLTGEAGTHRILLQFGAGPNLAFWGNALNLCSFFFFISTFHNKGQRAEKELCLLGEFS